MIPTECLKVFPKHCSLKFEFLMILNEFFMIYDRQKPLTYDE